MSTFGRINGFDALRTIAMWLGLVLHAIIVYKMVPEVNWPHDPGLNISFLDWLYHYIHMFRMPLFFMVAGFFARMVIARSGTKYFLKQRFRRIVIPFVIGVIIIVPISLFPFSYYQFHHVQQLPTNEALKRSFMQMGRWNGLAHLWFLYYLVIFYAISIVFVYLRKRIATKFIAANFFKKITPIHLVLVTALLAIIFYLNKTSEPEVYTGIKPNATYILHYGFFFACGWLLQTNMKSVNSLTKFAWPLFVAGTALSLAQFYEPGWFGESTMFWFLLIAVTIIALVVGLTGLFVRYFHSESPLWRYCSDAAYWVYLVHLSIVASLQVLMIGSPVPLALRLPIVLIGAMVLSILTYALFVRYTIIGEFLHGKRTRNTKSG